MFITPDQVQDQKLKRRLRGYKKVDVERLLEEVVTSYKQVWRERNELRSRVEELEKELAPLRGAERHLSDSLVTAERAAAGVRAQAVLDAEELLEKARAKSKGQLAGTKAQTTQLRNEIKRLELVEQELQASLRAFLLAGLELLEDREATSPTPVVEVPVANQTTS